MNRIDSLIAGCRDWAAFWGALTTPSPPASPGETLERLTQLYLLSHPEYRTQLKHVWRVPEEVPPRIRSRLNLPGTDEGIDLLAETHNGKFWAVQCKFRSDTKKALTYSELSTFTSLAFVTCRDISLAVVAHTCSKPVRKHKYLGEATEIGLDRWLGLTDEDWQAIHAQIGGKAVALAPRVPRPHQRAAIADAQAHFASASRGRMIMPCATGKSLTAFWIALALDAKMIIVAVPSLALIRQSLLDWTREYLAHGETPQWLVVCSDETTGKLEHDEFVGETYDLGIPTTTKPEDISPFLRRRTSRRIVFTTYQSSGVLARAARDAGVTFDLAILDEAHKTVGVKSKAFATLLSDSNVPIRRRLFMTATERVLRGQSDEVFSMDDEAVYGKRFHQLTFKDAIAKEIISDYRILTITVSDQTIRDLVAENRLIDVKGDETEAQTLAAAVALRRAYANHRITHAISFHRSIKAASEFCDRQAALDEAVDPKLTSLHVSSKKATGERAELMRQFVGEQRALLTNARCLTEGVDVPAIDCVMFADPKQSVIDIVQAAGRALRPYPGKEYGYILLPLVVPAGIEVKAFAETTAFKQVARTITALSTQDERIAEQFRLIEHGRYPTGKIVEIEGDVALGFKVDINTFAEQVATQLWARVGKANWRDFEHALDFARERRLRSSTAWGALRGSGNLPPDIPAHPDRAYRGRGWKGWGHWLGTGTVAYQLRPRRPFDEARMYARGLGCRNRDDWHAHARAGKLPPDIPVYADEAYRGFGWNGWGDWLGTGSVATRLRQYRSFADARMYARGLGLRNGKDWRTHARAGKLPSDIPLEPRNAYLNEGWTGWGDWLGTGRVRTYRPYEEARAFTQSLRLKSYKDYRRACKAGETPPDIPRAPNSVYRDSGWISWGDFLGTGFVPSHQRIYRPFEEARAYVRSLRLSGTTAWRRLVSSGELPADIPSTPAGVYRERGWVSLGDWLGNNGVASHLRTYRSFADARKFVHSLHLSSQTEWHDSIRSETLPRDIPRSPNTVYRDDGWLSWGDWFGTGYVAGVHRQYRHFEQARAFVRSLKLRDVADWQTYSKSGSRPSDIPSSPALVYPERWAGWGDWLGTGRRKRVLRSTKPKARLTDAGVP